MSGEESTILVVEDESIVAIDIIQTLQSIGYSVYEAIDSGEEALEFLQSETPDLILMDIQLSGDLDGIQTAKYVRENYQIPFIYISTFSDPITLSRAKLTQPYGYITKSFNQNILHTTIEMALHRHRMERIVREKEELLSITLKSISDAVIGTSLEGNIISWNKGAETIFGFTLEEIQGKNISIITPRFYPNEMPDMLDRLLSGEEIKPYQAVRQKRDGSVIDMSLKISPITDSTAQIIGVSIIGRDITEKKQLEKEILEIEERERTRIGQDLHDSLGQHLTGISLKLKALEKDLNNKKLQKLADNTKEIEDLVKDAVMHTRRLARVLMPVTLQHEGLPEALEELSVYAAQIYNIDTLFSADKDIVLKDEAISNQLYHIAQEAVNNAIKHSQSETVTISLKKEAQDICLLIQDNGVGLRNENNRNGLGLKIMQYRADMINGKLSVFSQSEGGTTVLCRVPGVEGKRI